MSRPKRFKDEELYEMLAQIEIQYGFLASATLQQAHKEKPFEFPSDKTFERRLGGFKFFNTPDFRDKLKIYTDKIKKSNTNT